MINFSLNPPRTGELTTVLIIVLSSSLPPFFLNEATAKARYKKETVVDFEEAMVEGKSRKPYSAYLTQQKEASFKNLHSWNLDFDRLQSLQKERLEAK